MMGETEAPEVVDAKLVEAGVVYELTRVLTKVTGQMVVEIPTMAVTLAMDVAERTGQLVTSGAQLKTVIWVVWKTVEVDTAGMYSTTRTLVRTGSVGTGQSLTHRKVARHNQPPMAWPQTLGSRRAAAAVKMVESFIVATSDWEMEDDGEEENAQ